MSGKAFLLLSFLLLPLAVAHGQRPLGIRPLTDSAIGRLGTADIRPFAPPGLQTAANQMSVDVRQYPQATKTFRVYLETNPDSKFAYIALCQLDADFREAEFNKWRNDPSEASATLFRKGISSYLYGLSYLMFNPAYPKQGAAAYRYPDFTDREKGPLATLNKLWLKEPDLLNGMALSAIQCDLNAPPLKSDFLGRLIELAAGKNASASYYKAEHSDWEGIPAVEEIDELVARKLCATLSNEISRQGAGVGGPDNTILDRQGQVKAVYSSQEQQWLFVQKGTQLHYIGEWRRQLKKRFGIP